MQVGQFYSVPCSSPGAAGFTLIELMVVIVIIAVLLVIGIPSFNSVTTQDRLAAELNDLSADLAFARTAAVARGVPVTVCASANPAALPPACAQSATWTTGWIVFRDVAGNQVYSAGGGDSLLRTHTALQGGDTLIGKPGTGAPFTGGLPAITFNRIGGTANFGVLSFHDAASTPGWSRCLLLSLPGSVAAYLSASTPGVCP